MTATNFLIQLKLFTLPDFINSIAMKRIAAILPLLFLTFGSLTAQILDPVKVTHSLKVISETEVELQVTAIMEEGWHIYSVKPNEESFVVYTEFNIPKSDNYKLIGGINEPKPIKEYDPNFEETLEFHENTVTFTQRIKVLTSSDFKVTGEFVYQSCNDRTCLTPEYVDLDFNIKIPAKANAITP